MEVGVVAFVSCVDNVGFISVGDDIPLLFEVEEVEEVGSSLEVEVFMFMLIVCAQAIH